MQKIRLLILSKPYVASAYRQKLRLMAEDPRFEIGLIVPHDWAGQAYEPDESDHYWIRKLPIVLNGHNHLHFYRGLDAAVREFRPDIFNIEEEHYSLVTAQCTWLARKYGAQCCFYTWQNIYKTYPPPFSWVEKFVFHSVSMGLAGNAEAIAILRRKGFHKPMAVLPQMGADTSALTRIEREPRADFLKREGLPNDAFLVAFAGRLVEEKGIQDMIGALARLHSLPIHMIILGNGPFQQQLEAYARDLKVQDQVLFLGSKKSTEVYRYLQQVQVLALPSHTRGNWKEQFGRILVEAMLSGAVVVGSDSGEIPRVIRGSGLVFPEGNVDLLAQRFLRLYKDQRLLQRLAEKGRRRAAKHYTNEVIAARTLEYMYGIHQSKERARELPAADTGNTVRGL